MCLKSLGSVQIVRRERERGGDTGPSLLTRSDPHAPPSPQTALFLHRLGGSATRPDAVLFEFKLSYLEVKVLSVSAQTQSPHVG